MKPEHYNGIRKRLARLDGLEHKTQADEQAIQQAAAERLTAVTDEINVIGARCVTDPSLGERYLELTREYGALRRVLAD